MRLRADGRVLVELKTAWRDGTSHLVLDPIEFMEKLAAIKPRPAVNLVGYHGVPHEGAGVPRHCYRPATTWANRWGPRTRAKTGGPCSPCSTVFDLSLPLTPSVSSALKLRPA